MFPCSPRLASITLAGWLAASMVRPAAAATPRLVLQCGAPSGSGVVSCQLTGAGFYPRERLTIVYRLATGRSSAEFRRTTAADGRGTFWRPPLRFIVALPLLRYTVAARVIGVRGDWASIESAGMP